MHVDRPGGTEKSPARTELAGDGAVVLPATLSCYSGLIWLALSGVITASSTIVARSAVGLIEAWLSGPTISSTTACSKHRSKNDSFAKWFDPFWRQPPAFLF
jgi:hypothetical protein